MGAVCVPEAAFQLQEQKSEIKGVYSFKQQV